MAHMDDILELLNMPSWSDIGGLRNQLDFNSATAASGAEAGTIPACPSASGSATNHVKSEQQQLASSNSLPVPDSHKLGLLGQDARGVHLSNDDMYLGSPMHHQRHFALDNSQVLGVNCNVMANQSSGGGAMHLGGESSMLSSACNMFATTPSGPLGLHFEPWRQQPVIGDMQPFAGPELFGSSNAAMYGTTRYRDAGGTPINLRIVGGSSVLLVLFFPSPEMVYFFLFVFQNRDHGRVFGGYPGPQLGHPRPPVQTLQPNTGSRVYRSQTVPQPAMGGAPRPRVRARRGQATDPHSIAERQRRERIADRVKELQMLVPNACKTDRAMLLDEIIEYVKFLQLQAKILDISHSHGAVPSLLPTEYGNTLGQSNGTTSEALASIERQVAKLMDENMDAALQFMQSKGFCLMPISMAAALSSATKGVHQPILSGDKLEASTSTVVTERPTGSGQK